MNHRQVNTETLEELLTRVVGLAQAPESSDYRIVIFAPTMQTNIHIRQRLRELLSKSGANALVRDAANMVEFGSGCTIRLLSSTLVVRGISVTHIGMYQHPAHPWSGEDFGNVLPALRNNYPNNFVWVTE